MPTSSGSVGQVAGGLGRARERGAPWNRERGLLGLWSRVLLGTFERGLLGTGRGGLLGTIEGATWTGRGAFVAQVQRLNKLFTYLAYVSISTFCRRSFNLPPFYHSSILPSSLIPSSVQAFLHSSIPPLPKNISKKSTLTVSSVCGLTCLVGIIRVYQ